MSDKKIDLDRAIKYFKQDNPEKAKFMQDKEAIKLFVIKFIPSLKALREEFFKILEKY